MNIPQRNSPEFYELKDIQSENVNPFLGFAPSDAKDCKVNFTEPGEMIDQDEERQCEWRSNILITSNELKERTPFALRHLTSFEEKSMDGHGKRLAESFRDYICWVQKHSKEQEVFENKTRLSNLDWDTVQEFITREEKLTEEERKLLVSVAYKCTQAELILSEIIEQIPENYYAVALSIAASLIRQFNELKLRGKDQNQISNFVSSYYIVGANKIYHRLCQLDMANKEIRDHQCYLNFIRMWMEVFFLSLNGFLENPVEQRKRKASAKWNQ